METQQVSIKKIATNHGVLLGGILAVLTTLMYVIDLELMTQWWVGIITFLLAITVGIVSIAKSKGSLNGFISFKEAFTSYFITIAVGLIISVLISIVIFNLVDPEAAEFLKERIMEVSRNMMEKFGAPESEIEKALIAMQEEDSFGVIAQLKSYVFQLAFYSVFGLLVALIFKRNDPNVIE